MTKAILFGASGFVGSHLLNELLENPDYSEVIAVVRKKLNISHQKLKALIGDYHSLPEMKDDLVADEIFIALGTTRKNTPDKDKYYQTDHDYPLLAAKIAKHNGARSILIVTAVGADPNSRFSYVKTKGEVERDITALDFEHAHFFRPSMIMGSRKENRFMERSLIKLWSLINPLLIGNLKKFKGIAGENIAKAMVRSAGDQREKVRIYQWEEMNRLLEE